MKCIDKKCVLSLTCSLKQEQGKVKVIHGYTEYEHNGKLIKGCMFYEKIKVKK